MRGYNISNKIYMIKEDNELVEMREKQYKKEIEFQELIAQYPNLLAIDADNPRKWLMVSREMPLSFEEDGAKLLSLDHLFLDQDGIPTLVEVKRSSDTRLRREVIAQMLDYAANAVAYLKTAEMREKIESNNGELILQDDFLKDMDEARYWEIVKTNLQAGKIRMLFVADEIPKELKRIVEFLNEQMDPAEVLAVEIKQFKADSDNIRTIVPMVIGQTIEAQSKKSTPPREPLLNEKTFIEYLDATGKEFFDEFFKFIKQNNLQIKWGTKGFSLNVEKEGKLVSILQGYTQLSAYKQSIFSTANSISNKIKNGDQIASKFVNNSLKLNDFYKVGNGFKFNIDRNLNNDEWEQFEKILFILVKDIDKKDLLH